MPAGFMELEAAARHYHIRAAVCCQEIVRMVWVGQPSQQQIVLLFWHKHWSLLPVRIEDPGHR
eukprot:10587002-Prorocentrum_lima.AAC.1